MTAPAPAPSSAPAGNRVLLLGSGDDASAKAVELLQQLGLEPVVIESPSIERLDAVRDAGYAIVLPSKDSGDAMMLAIGFMLALLGRSRIVLLGGEVPDALKGATHIEVDDEDLWPLLLARQMKRAGLEVDLNRAL